MALEKNDLAINFTQGVDTQTDPFQVQPGKFLSLKNSVFTKGRLEKRNGFGKLTALSANTFTYLTTFNNNLTAIGPSLDAYSAGSETWVSKGIVQPVEIDVMPVVRSNTTHPQADAAVSRNNLVCTVFTDSLPSGTAYKYVIADRTTGQNIIAPSLITPSAGAVSGSPRVFCLGSYFVIVFTATITATPHLQFIAVNIYNPTSVTTAVDISSTYTPATTVNFDGVVTNNSLYLAWNGSDGGGAVRATYIDSTLTQHATVTYATRVSTLMSVTADETGSTSVIYISFYNLATTSGYTIAVNPQMVTVLAATQWIAAGTILNLTSSAQNGVCTLIYETSNVYTYAAIASNYVSQRTITQAGSLGTAAVIVRSVGLATKSFLVDGSIYFLGVYSSSDQPSYFLLSLAGNVIAKLAYQNAGGYITLGLPSVGVLDDEIVSFAYQFRDLLLPVNKTQGATSSSANYAQTGINLARIKIGSSRLSTVEIGNNLNFSGGFLWGYDGNVAVESGFHLYPEAIIISTSAVGGLLAAQQYFYKVIYEWTDAQGNIFRSAPSIPQSITTAGATSSNTINVPTLRLTRKTANPVKIVIYRASANQATYYQITSISAPTFSSTTSDSVAYVDTLADSSIVGASIIYTNGGVIENTGAPATDVMALYKSRLMMVDAEDKNLLWYSKQVIESTPVEMSDLYTIYVAPTTAAQGPTGPMTALSAMDDKFIIFKKNAIYYLTGDGPDNTGANNDFSDPTFITSTVGCDNHQSIVMTPNGLMFQSDKGIWLLGRDLSTTYIGAAVEDFNGFEVLSAVNIPGTNEVRFVLENGVILMFDYYYSQWGIFEGAPAISSTLYEGLHTIIDSLGRVSQETPGKYLDGSKPVLMSFVTSWMNLLGLQGYERAYFFYLLGTYISPHKLSISIGYDYSVSPSQNVIISPDNFAPVYGDDTIYGGGSPYGGASSLEQWRVFFDRQKVQAFQLTVQELFDPTFGTIAGAGLTLSGINMTVGAKGKYPRIKTANTVG